MRQTSIDTYNKIKANGLLSNRRWQVYDILFRYGPITAGEVAKLMKSDKGIQLGPNANTTSRLSELRDMGVVSEIKERECSVTNMTVIEWDVTDRTPVNTSVKDKILKQIEATKNKLVKLEAKLAKLGE